MKDYTTVKDTALHEICIQRSRFIGQAFALDTETQAEEFLHQVRGAYPDASHHCYAYVCGEDGGIQRFIDDGEPGGTAGMPILQVILQQGLKNTLVVVTRYFGGVKLGAGGLVRAYTKTAAQTLNEAGRKTMSVSTQGAFTIPYNALSTLEYFLKCQGIPILNAIYTENVEVMVIIPGQDWTAFAYQVVNLLHGNADAKILDAIYYAWD